MEVLELKRKTNLENGSSVCKCRTPSILAFSMIETSTDSSRTFEITDTIPPAFRAGLQFLLKIAIFCFLKNKQIQIHLQNFQKKKKINKIIIPCQHYRF